jgi:transposase
MQHGPFQKTAAGMAERQTHRSRPPISLTAQERDQLLHWIRARTVAHRIVVRSHIILLASEGLSVSAIAASLHVARATVRLWCDRFRTNGLAALERERPGRGRRRGISPGIVHAVLRAMQTAPQDAHAWTARSLAAAAGTSASTVCRIWKRFGVGASSPSADIVHLISEA